MTASIVNILSLACACVLASRYFFPPVISFITGKTSLQRESVRPFECGFCLSFWAGVFIIDPLSGCLVAVCGAFIDRNL